MYVVLCDEVFEFLFFGVDAILNKLQYVDVMCAVRVGCCTGEGLWGGGRWWRRGG